MPKDKALTSVNNTSYKSVRWITVTAIGIALFVVLTLCLQMPVFENYYLCLGYIIMAVCLYSFGTVSGIIVGVIGVLLYCILTGGLRGMPGWAAGNLLIGIIIGLAFNETKKLKKKWLQAVLDFLAILLSTALGILILKSAVEWVLYSQPLAVRMGKNVFAFAADIFVLEISLPICMSLDPVLKKMFKN